MPNHLQFLFLASFLITFLALFALSNLLASTLRQAGYDFSRIILIGLPPPENTHPNQMSTSAPFLDVRVVALLFAALSGAFIYLKFGRSGTSLFLTYLRLPLTLPAAV
jgi:cytochrome-b5 reductase